MEITYEKGTLFWYWYEDWIVVGGFAVALVVAAWVRRIMPTYMTAAGSAHTTAAK